MAKKKQDLSTSSQSILSSSDDFRSYSEFLNSAVSQPQLTVILDIGNSDVKCMIQGARGHEIVFPQAVSKRTPEEYKILEQSYKMRPADFRGTAIFKIGNDGYVVGKHAQMGRHERMVGSNKYIREHMSPIIVAAMLQMGIAEHQNIELIILHPARITPANMKALWKSVKGIHKAISIDGTKLHYDFGEEIIAREEGIASAQAYFLDENGRTRRTETGAPLLRPGDHIMDIDLGGWVMTISPIEIDDNGNFQPIFDGIYMAQIGIQNVMDTLSDQLRMVVPEYANLERVPERKMVDAIAWNSADGKKYIDVQGELVECTVQVHNAIEVIAGPIRQQFNGRFQNGVEFKSVLMSGGGGGIAFPYFEKQVIHHRHFAAVLSDYQRMRYTNIIGADYGYCTYVISGNWR